jgi:hypothetical protein
MYIAGCGNEFVFSASIAGVDNANDSFGLTIGQYPVKIYDSALLGSCGFEVVLHTHLRLR